MGFDATTFVLEIVNFLVLLWLLTRFLFRPVQAFIARRQQEAESARQALADQGRQLQEERAGLARQRAEQELARDAALRQLADDIAAERTRRMVALEQALADERARAAARMAAQQQQAQRQLDAQAATRADAFLRGYLARLAGPELEQAIIGLFLHDLAALDDAARHRLLASPPDGPIEIATAYLPGDTLRQRVEASLAALFGKPVGARWSLDPAVVAGLIVKLDGHVIGATLAHALDAFAGRSESAS